MSPKENLAAPDNPRDWTSNEKAFILYARDICLACDVAYADNVLDALKRYSGRTIQSFNSINNRFRKIFLDNGAKAPSFSKFLAEGFAALDVNDIPQDVRDSLERLRLDWESGKPTKLKNAILDTADFPTSAVDHSDVDEAHTERAARQRSENDSTYEVPENALIAVATRRRRTQVAGSRRSLAIEETPEPLVASKPGDVGQLGSTASVDQESSGMLQSPRPTPDIRSPATPPISDQMRTGPVKTVSKRNADTMVEEKSLKRVKDTQLIPFAAPNETSSAPPSLNPNVEEEVKRLHEQIAVLQSQIETQRSQQELLLAATRELLEKQLERKGTLTTMSKSGVARLLNDMRDPEAFDKKREKDLRTMRTLCERHNSLVRRMLKGVPANLSDDFLVAPDPRSMEQQWSKPMRKLRRIAGLQDKNPESLPTREAACYLTAHMERILSKTMGDEQLDEIIEDAKEHISSPHALQSFLSALFCCELFQSPEPICGMADASAMVIYEMIRMRGKQHPIDPSVGLDEDPGAVLNQDPALSAAEGVAEVQHLDKLVWKDRFESQDQKAEDRKRAVGIIDMLNATLQDIQPDIRGFVDVKTHEGWAMDAVQLKKSLMISPDDYRVHISRAGNPFDPAWMTAVAADGYSIQDSEVGQRTVALCLFPAIFRRGPVPLNGDASTADALVGNRRFLPTPRERRSSDTSSCIAKATVLIL